MTGFLSPRALCGAAAILILNALNAASASPWVRERGNVFIASRAEYTRAISDAPLDGALGPSRFERTDSELYVEWGVFRTVTLGGKARYGVSNSFDGFEETTSSGISETEAFIQHEILRNHRNVFSVKLTGAAPARIGSGVRPQTLADGAEAELRALYGRNVFSRPFKAFTAIEAGYRRNFGDASDQVRIDALVGIEPWRRLLILAEVFSTTSLRNAVGDGADYDVVKIQPSAAFQISRRISVHGGMTREVSGRNLVLGNAYFLSIWTEF